MSSALARAEVLRALLPGGSLPSLPGAASLAGSTSSVSTTPSSVRRAPCCQSNCGPWMPSTWLRRDGSARTWPRSSPTTSGWQLPLALWATRSHRLPDHTASLLAMTRRLSARKCASRDCSVRRDHLAHQWPSQLGRGRGQVPPPLACGSKLRETVRLPPLRPVRPTVRDHPATNTKVSLLHMGQTADDDHPAGPAHIAHNPDNTRLRSSYRAAHGAEWHPCGCGGPRDPPPALGLRISPSVLRQR